MPGKDSRNDFKNDILILAGNWKENMLWYGVAYDIHNVQRNNLSAESLMQISRIYMNEPLPNNVLNLTRRAQISVQRHWGDFKAKRVHNMHETRHKPDGIY